MTHKTLAPHHAGVAYVFDLRLLKQEDLSRAGGRNRLVDFEARMLVVTTVAGHYEHYLESVNQSINN